MTWTNASTRNAFQALLNQIEGVGIPLEAMVQDARTVEDLANGLRV